MKILQVIHDFLPTHQAGAELYCYYLSQALRAKGHDVRLFYSEIDHARPAYSLRRGEYEGLPFWEIVNNHTFSSFEETYRNPRIENVFADCLDEFQPDAVHFHHLLGLSFGCVRLCKERKIPIVFTLHDYWLTCPRNGGQRFRGEGQICHSVDRSLCAECISRYSFGVSRGIRPLKKILSWMERGREGTLLARMAKGKIRTPQRTFVSRGQCDIGGDSREVIYAHPPSTIVLRCDIAPDSDLLFAIGMPPSVYEQLGNGVRFTIRCAGETLFDRALHPKQLKDDRGWHSHRISLKQYAGRKRELVFETQADPGGEIDFCSACWAEPRIAGHNSVGFQPSLQSRFQSSLQRWLARFQQKSLQAKVETRTRRTFELFEWVDLFIAPSRFLRNKFIEYGLSPEKIVYSDYGIYTQGYPISTRPFSLPLRFTYIGTLAEHKGLHVLIEAFNRLPLNSALLNVYGNTSEFTDYVQRIQNAIAHPGIVLKGRAENSDIPGILADTDVLVVPSIWFENSPITIHEAFLSRTPVVTSRFGGMADLVRDEHNGLLFELGNADSLYACLLRCIENPQFLNTIRPRPEDVKTLETDADWMLETYRRLK